MGGGPIGSEDREFLVKIPLSVYPPCQCTQRTPPKTPPPLLRWDLCIKFLLKNLIISREIIVLLIFESNDNNPLKLCRRKLTLAQPIVHS